MMMIGAAVCGIVGRLCPPRSPRCFPLCLLQQEADPRCCRADVLERFF